MTGRMRAVQLIAPPSRGKSPKPWMPLTAALSSGQCQRSARPRGRRRAHRKDQVDELALVLALHDAVDGRHLSLRDDLRFWRFPNWKSLLDKFCQVHAN